MSKQTQSRCMASMSTEKYPEWTIDRTELRKPKRASAKSKELLNADGKREYQ